MEHIEKVLNRYVIATFDIPTNYLVVNGNKTYSFIDNITKATKFTQQSVANEILHTCGLMYDFDMVLLPMKIKYVLIEDDE